MQAQVVDFVYYTVSDFEESVSFYRDTLGLEAEMVNAEMGWAEFAAPPTTLALREAEKDESVDSGGAAVALGVDDVEAAVDEMKQF